MNRKYILYGFLAFLIIGGICWGIHKHTQPQGMVFAGSNNENMDEDDEGNEGDEDNMDDEEDIPDFPDGTLEIHQINVDNGDGAIMVVRDKTNTIQKAVMIDAGMPSGSRTVIPYIKNYLKHFSFDWVIVSHFHTDHYQGFIDLFQAEFELPGNKTENFTTKNLIDPGGYNLDKPAKLSNTKPAVDNNIPMVASMGGRSRGRKYWSAVQKLKENSKEANGVDVNYFPSTDFDPEDLGDPSIFETPITICTIDSVPLTLTCVALNGYTIDADGVGFITRKVGGNNPNNFSFAWLIELGEFRMFSGGDMGGFDDGAYTDQETKVSEYFLSEFTHVIPYSKKPPNTNDHAFDGHVCVMKANHHGSSHSNNQALLDAVAPTTFITSVGSNTSWHLPADDFITRLSNMKRIQPQKTLILFTQIFNFKVQGVKLPEDENDEEEPGITSWQPTFNRAKAAFSAANGYVFGDGNHYIISVKARFKLNGKSTSIKDLCAYHIKGRKVQDLNKCEEENARGKRKRWEIQGLDEKCATILPSAGVTVGCHYRAGALGIK